MKPHRLCFSSLAALWVRRRGPRTAGPPHSRRELLESRRSSHKRTSPTAGTERHIRDAAERDSQSWHAAPCEGGVSAASVGLGAADGANWPGAAALEGGLRRDAPGLPVRPHTPRCQRRDDRVATSRHPGAAANELSHDDARQADGHVADDASQPGCRGRETVAGLAIRRRRLGSQAPRRAHSDVRAWSTSGVTDRPRDRTGGCGPRSQAISAQSQRPIWPPPRRAWDCPETPGRGRSVNSAAVGPTCRRALPSPDVSSELTPTRSLRVSDRGTARPRPVANVTRQ